MNVDPHLLLLCKSATLGDDEPDLGAKLMRNFLTMLLESGRLPTKCIFLGSGVFLTTQGSAVRDLLEAFASNGSEVLSCSTCLEYYQRADKLEVGRPTTMRDTVEAMLTCSKVLTP